MEYEPPPRLPEPLNVLVVTVETLATGAWILLEIPTNALFVETAVATALFDCVIVAASALSDCTRDTCILAAMPATCVRPGTSIDAHCRALEACGAAI